MSRTSSPWKTLIELCTASNREGLETFLEGLSSDPFGGFKLRTGDCRSIGQQFTTMNIPTLICQEGGYNIDVPGKSGKNFLLGFMES